jgi:hypothetical protein
MTDILIPKKNVIFDSQILSTCMSCPRLCDFRFNIHLQSVNGKSKSLIMGSIVHKCLEVYYRSIINGLSKSQAEGSGHIAGLEFAQSDEARNATDDEKNYALDTYHQYLEYYKNDYWIPLEVETVHNEILFEDDEVRVMWKAKFDAIFDTNQGIYPVDHKTMSQRRDTLTLNNQFIGQCILCKTRLMFVNKIGFQKSLKSADKFTRDPINYSLDRLLEWQNVILPYYAKFYLMYMESEYWPPNFTHCENKWGVCEFKNVCEADRNMREEVLGNEFIVGEAWEPKSEE